MKMSLKVPSKIVSNDMEQFKNDPRRYGIERQIALKKQRQADFEIMLDKWKKAGHSLEAGKLLVLNIRGEK